MQAGRRCRTDVDVGANVEHNGLRQRAGQGDERCRATWARPAASCDHSITFGDQQLGGRRRRRPTKLRNVVNTFKGAETSPGVADTRSHPDAGRAHRPRELHGLGRAQPARCRSSAWRPSRTSWSARVSSTSMTRVERRGRRRNRGDGRRGRERPPRRHRDRQRRRPEHGASHEFGHAFGLGDEYANTPLVSSGLGRNTGTPQMGDDGDARHARQEDGRRGRPAAGGRRLRADGLDHVGGRRGPPAALRDLPRRADRRSRTRSRGRSGPPTGRNDPLPAGAAGGGVQGPGDFPVPQPGEPVRGMTDGAVASPSRSARACWPPARAADSRPWSALWLRPAPTACSSPTRRATTSTATAGACSRDGRYELFTGHPGEQRPGWDVLRAVHARPGGGDPRRRRRGAGSRAAGPRARRDPPPQDAPTARFTLARPRDRGRRLAGERPARARAAARQDPRPAPPAARAQHLGAVERGRSS